MTMKKKISLLIGIFSFVLLHAQVGINSLPSLAGSILHIDGKGDNTSSSTVTPAQVANDIIITSDGNIGVGTANPTYKLEIIASNGKGFRLVDGSEGAGKFLVSDKNGIATWKGAINTRLVWDANRKFTIPHTGIYLITLYFDDNNTTNAYTNKWYNPPLDNGTNFNGVALWSETRGNYVISNANSLGSYGVSCSGTLMLNKGEIVRPGALAWSAAARPTLGVEIIPL